MFGPGWMVSLVAIHRCFCIEFAIVVYVIGTRLTAIACLPDTTHSGTLARSYRTDLVRFAVKFMSGGDGIRAMSSCSGGFPASFCTMTGNRVRRSMWTMLTVRILGRIVSIDGELNFRVRIPRFVVSLVIGGSGPKGTFR